MAASFTIDNGFKTLVLDDGAKVPVTAPLSLDDGSYVRLVEPQRLLLADIKESIDALVAAQGATTAQQVLNASDLRQTFTYLDAGTVNQRVATITYASEDAGYAVLDTYSYGGSTGAYFLNTIIRSVSAL